jgi:hypothetical protein
MKAAAAATRRRIKKLLSDASGEGLSSLQLATFLRGDRLIRRHRTFVKVLPRDLLAGVVPEIRAHLANNSTHKPSIVVICNNQTSAQPGQHWVLVFHGNDQKKVDFFCSYGLSVDSYPKEIRKFCVSLCKVLSLPRANVVSNRTCVQGLFSAVCGHHCMLLALLRVRKYSNKHFLNLLRSSPAGEFDEILPDILLDGRFKLRYIDRLERKFKREEFRAGSVPIQRCCRRIDSLAAAAAANLF